MRRLSTCFGVAMLGIFWSDTGASGADKEIEFVIFALRDRPIIAASKDDPAASAEERAQATEIRTRLEQANRTLSIRVTQRFAVGSGRPSIEGGAVLISLRSPQRAHLGCPSGLR